MSERRRCSRSSRGAGGDEAEGDDGLLVALGGGELPEERVFLLVRGEHFAGFDFFGLGLGEAEFADGEAAFFAGADGGTEDAAGHGAGGVEVAEAGFGFEGGAGGVVGVVLEGELVGFGGTEDAGGGVPGEGGEVFGEPGGGAGDDAGGAGWVGVVEVCHAGAEAAGVEGVEGEGSVAALGAAGAAGEVGAAAEDGRGEGLVCELDEAGVGGLEVGRGGVGHEVDGKCQWSVVSGQWSGVRVQGSGVRVARRR